MANAIKLGSLYLDGSPVEIGAEYVTGQSIKVGKTVPGKEICWVAVNGMLIADRCLLTHISGDDLDAQGLVFGKEIIVQGFRFKVRLLKVGSEKGVPNEWDAALDAVGEDNGLWHWSERYFWGQESVRGSASYRAYRGYYSARYWDWDLSSRRYASRGFRPALEPLPTAPSALRPGQEVMAIGRDGCVVGQLVEKTQYDLILRPKAGVAPGISSFATNIQDGTLAIDRDRILGIATA